MRNIWRPPPALLLPLAVFAYPLGAGGYLAFGHNVDHGTLKPLSNDGFERRYASEFPVISGWRNTVSPTNAGNSPAGHIWVHQLGGRLGQQLWPLPCSDHQGAIRASKLDQRAWSWGVYYVYGENKNLEFGAFDSQYPPGTVSYSISNSAGAVPEPTSSCLILLGIVGIVVNLGKSAS